MNTTACLFICLWIDAVVSQVIPPRKSHSSGALATGAVSFPSLGISCCVLVFPSRTFLFGFILRAAGAGTGREAGPGDLGGEGLGAAFPSLQGCCGHSLRCRSQPASWGLAGRGLCCTPLLQGLLSLTAAVPRWLCWQTTASWQRAAPASALCALPASFAAMQGRKGLLALFASLVSFIDTVTLSQTSFSHNSALVPLNYKGTQLSIKWLNRYL